MRRMTEEAARLVGTLAARGALPARGGVRIVLNPISDSLSMGLAAGPEPADEIIARDGARLFLSAPAAQRTRGRTLCADVTPARSTFFLES